ncbi:unnamed protein product, partial [Hanseniaspora opuntiae]
PQLTKDWSLDLNSETTPEKSLCTSKKTSNFDLVPIAFIAACIAAAG